MDLEPRISYINKTYDDIKEYIIRLIPKITDKWTNFNESDIGIVIIELFAAIADMLNFYIDNQANESYLKTALERKNIYKLVQLIGYKPHNYISSQGTAIISIDSPISNDILIPKWTQISSKSNLKFYTMEEAIIHAGDVSTSVKIKEGLLAIETVNSPGIQDWEYKLNNPQIDITTISVRFNNIEWEWKKTLINSTKDDTHYTTYLDAEGNVYLIFGDGINGKMPDLEDVGEIKYLLSNGEIGNVGSDFLTNIDNVIYDSAGNKIDNINVQNNENITGGTGVETLNHIKKYAGKELRTLDRMVTVDDYKTIIDLHPSICKSAVYDISNADKIPFRFAKIYAIPNGGGNLTTSQKADLLEYVSNYALIGTTAIIDDVKYKNIDFEINAYYYSQYDKNVIKNTLNQIITDYFSVESEYIEFGTNIVNLTELYSMLNEVEGVAYIDNINPTESFIELEEGEYPLLSTYKINMEKVN